MGCLFYVISCDSSGVPLRDSFISENGLINKALFERYWVTVYQVVVTVTTVGYGDINIAFNNASEMSFLCMLMIVSSMLYAFMLAVIHSSIVSRLTQGKAHTLEIFAVWANTKGVCEKRTNRIANLIKFQYSVDQDTQEVMNSVSPVACRYFRSQALLPVLLQNDIFVSLSESLLRDLCQEMRLTAVVNNTLLVSEGDFENDIYFVDRGRIIACLENKEGENKSMMNEEQEEQKIVSLYEYGPGMACMATCLFSELRSPVSLRAKEHSILYVMNSNNIHEIMKWYIRDFKKLKHLSLTKELVPIYEKIIETRQHDDDDADSDADEIISIVIQVCSVTAGKDVTRIDVFKDQEIVKSNQNMLNQSVNVGPLNKSSGSVLRFVLNGGCMKASIKISNILRHDKNEITLEIEEENGVCSKPSSQIVFKYFVRRRSLQRQKRDEILRDVKALIEKYNDGLENIVHTSNREKKTDDDDDDDEDENN